MVTVDSFRNAFPEFSCVSAFPADQIAFWLDMGQSIVCARKFGRSADAALMLFVAHNLALSAADKTGVQTGQVTGGSVASKTVGDASISYDSAESSAADADQWNLTTYGKRFWMLLRIYGISGFQV